MKKMGTHIAPMHPFVAKGPFVKWGVDFMTWYPASISRNRYIIVAIEYLTKWVEAMPSFSNMKIWMPYSCF